MRSGLHGLMLAAAMAAGASGAVACALEEDVSLSRDTLNHYYPDALDVLSRIVDSRRAGALSKPAEVPQALILRRQMGSLQRLDVRMRAAAKDVKGPAFAVLLIETMLWSRFPGRPDAPAELHAQGPLSGDLVVVMGEDALREIVSGRMTPAVARDKGWLRLYGPDLETGRLAALIVAATTDAPR